MCPSNINQLPVAPPFKDYPAVRGAPSRVMPLVHVKNLPNYSWYYSSINQLPFATPIRINQLSFATPYEFTSCTLLPPYELTSCSYSSLRINQLLLLSLKN